MGRPRSFDTEAALDRAMRVFWRRGYEGASLAELLSEMGIARPSLYAAFGSKEGLFRAVLARYAAGPSGQVLAAPTARAAVEALLRGAVALTADPAHPGCLLVQGALASGEANAAVRIALAAARQGGEAALRARLEQGVAEGELPVRTDCAALAGFYATLAWGLAVRATHVGASAETERIVGLALATWPQG